MAEKHNKQMTRKEMEAAVIELAAIARAHNEAIKAMRETLNAIVEASLDMKPKKRIIQ